MNSLGRRLLYLLIEAIELIYLVFLIPFVALAIALEWAKDYQCPTWLRLLLWGAWYLGLFWSLYQLNEWIMAPLPHRP
jgi:hypothetical protein